MSSVRLLRLPPVLDRRARTRSTHYNDIAQGTFTPPVHIGRCSVWPEHEVDTIIRAQVAGASIDELRLLVQRLITERGHTDVVQS